MKATKCLDEEKVIEKGVDALHEALGPVDAQRFLQMKMKKGEDSVTRHRKWQGSLNKDDFFKKVFQRKKGKK